MLKVREAVGGSLWRQDRSSVLLWLHVKSQHKEGIIFESEFIAFVDFWIVVVAVMAAAVVIVLVP
jgi:hypothetical protein